MDKTLGVVRHLLSGLGGLLVGLGYANQEDVDLIFANLETILGAAMAIVATGASIWEKVSRNA